MAKEKRATEKLNVAIARLESNLTVLKTALGSDGEKPPLKGLLAGADEAVEEIREHFLTIQFHLAQL